MCDQNSLQRHIRRLTNDGEVVARFLVDTVQGKTPGAKACHQVKAMEYLVRFGLTDQPATPDRHSCESRNPQEYDKFWGLIPTPEELATTPSRHSRESENPQGQDEDKNPTHPVHPVSSHVAVRSEPVEERARDEVTYLDILNFELAQLVRSETAEGHTIAEFLYDVVTGKEEPFTPKKTPHQARGPHDGRDGDTAKRLRPLRHDRRKLVDDIEEANDYDTLHTDLAKRMRQYGDHGSDVIRFLLDVMHNTYPDEEFTMRHRVSAAQELTRRGWDTNFDKIKMEHLVDYWRDQQDAILSVGQKKDLAGLHTFADEYDTYDDKTLKDYKAIAKDVHAQQDRESEERERQRKERQRSESDSNRHSSVPDRLSRESGKPEGQGGDKNPTHPVHPVSYEDENPTHHASSGPDPDQDFYYEPLSPEDQSLFDYYDLIESGNYKEGEIHPRPVTETMRLGYEATLSWMRESAAAEGVPLVPNPLSGTFTHPNARSP